MPATEIVFDTHALPNCSKKFSHEILEIFVDEVVKAKVLTSAKMSLMYLNTATPSPQLCSKLTAAIPSFEIIKLKDLSNHLKKKKK